MGILAIALSLVPLAIGQGAAPDPLLETNPIARELLEKGFVVDDATVTLPAPCLRDGMTEAEQVAALKRVIDVPIDDFLRNSPNAPFKLSVRDVPYRAGVVRVIDLWFAIHADLDEIDVDEIAGKKNEGGKGEAGNMAVSVRSLTEEELKAHSKTLQGDLDRFAVSKGNLLDRIEFVTTNHIVATKADASLLVASMTDHAFDSDNDLSNRWIPLPDPGQSKEDLGEARPYVGSAGYTKISQLSMKPSIVLVESHVAFVEPKAWFNGSSILRAKIGLIARDQIRRLRREVVTRRKKLGETPATKP